MGVLLDCISFRKATAMRLSGLQGKARHSGARGYAKIAAMHRFMCTPLAQLEQQSMPILVFHGATVLLVTLGYPRNSERSTGMLF